MVGSMTPTKRDPRAEALRRLADLPEQRRRLDQAELDAIVAARALTPPIPWRTMGEAMGTTGQYLQRHFGSKLVTTVQTTMAPDATDVTSRTRRRRRR